MFLPGALKACLFGVKMSAIKNLVLVLLSMSFLSGSSFAYSEKNQLAGLQQPQDQAQILANQAPSSGDLDSRMQNPNFPIHPDDKETPGDVCTASNAFRYPEHIKYCDRNVSSGTKNDIIAKYDRIFGYKVGSATRADFKIDHLIPLCLGGSNEVVNLWPQHKSVYAITDPIEPELCNKLAQGRIKQKDAIELVLYAKHHLGECDQILHRIQAM